MSEKSILPLCHVDAYEYFKVNTDLKSLFEDLSDPEKRRGLDSVKIFSPFAPMLSKRAIPDDVASWKAGYWIETKIDGERMQMHMEKGNFKWWTRNSTDYSQMYGETCNEGSLVPYIHNCFKQGVKNCILDGEMVAYNTETKKFEPFGSLKTASNDVNENGMLNRKCHPCFVVFDLLLLNGTSIIDQPLFKRYEWLQKLIVGNEASSTHIQLLHHDIGRTVEDANLALENRLSNNEEGIIIKNPNSVYQPGGKSLDWIKIKPDYIEGMGDDFDLVMVGAYFGQGRKGGMFGSFLCAVLDDSANPNTYISFCKFGSGFSFDEYPIVSLEKEGNWENFDPDRKPDWLMIPIKKDW
jgi:DNA ligase-4